MQPQMQQIQPFFAKLHQYQSEQYVNKNHINITDRRKTSDLFNKYFIQNSINI